jgi:hypothetical protein
MPDDKKQAWYAVRSSVRCYAFVESKVQRWRLLIFQSSKHSTFAHPDLATTRRAMFDVDALSRPFSA